MNKVDKKSNPEPLNPEPVNAEPVNAYIITKYRVPDLWGCGRGRFPAQNVCKMAYGDEDATSESLNP